jgi:hypothetical protein
VATNVLVTLPARKEPLRGNGFPVARSPVPLRTTRVRPPSWSTASAPGTPSWAVSTSRPAWTGPVAANTGAAVVAASSATSVPTATIRLPRKDFRMN